MSASNHTNTTYTDYEVTNLFKTGLFFYRVNAYVDCGIASGFTDYATFSGAYWFKQIASDDDQGDLPENFAVSAYPNPFNPATTISYALPQASRVSLAIYDMLGREMRRWDLQEPAGYRQVVWDGTDLAGRLVPTGIYIYRLVATSTESGERFVGSKKIVLME